MSSKTFRQDQMIMIGSACLISGFLLGLLAGYAIVGAPAPSPASATAPVPSISPPGGALGNAAAEIRELRQIVEQDPKNRGAWVRLGNVLFDSNQHNDAIQAYTKALEINPNDPDVITDRAVMYRAIGDFPQAAAELRRAADLDPKHLNSALNLGVVLRYDLNDAEGAIKAWQAYLERNPPADMADKIRKEIETLRSGTK